LGSDLRDADERNVSITWKSLGICPVEPTDLSVGRDSLDANYPICFISIGLSFFLDKVALDSDLVRGWLSPYKFWIELLDPRLCPM